MKSYQQCGAAGSMAPGILHGAPLLLGRYLSVMKPRALFRSAPLQCLRALKERAYLRAALWEKGQLAP